jgi:hypothetical protein
MREGEAVLTARELTRRHASGRGVSDVTLDVGAAEVPGPAANLPGAVAGRAGLDRPGALSLVRTYHL